MKIVIRGTVQGVGFRPAVYRASVISGASGSVWNDGSDVVIDTDRGDELLEALLSDLPPLARVESVEKIDSVYSGPNGFRISESKEGGHGATIPVDTAVCDRCLEDMFGNGRRSRYAFTTCTDCGPRYTLLKGIPYDRRLTSMSSFPLCPECSKEFTDPSDRRFHHQTICCPTCGPHYTLLMKDGSVIEDDPIGKLAGMIDSGSIVVIKGWGGMHICCRLEDIGKMREWYGRKNKPFAIMVKDIATARKYSEPDVFESEMLTSPQRPIVLVKKIPSALTECASPGLDNIGLFLPYTGIHHLLFSRLECDALVMTSANLPGEPMLTDNSLVTNLGADAYLIHDQDIVSRADDSVLRMFGDKTQFIRRSRGFIPFRIDVGIEGDAIALGAQENLSGCVASDGRIWPTQYIGNGEKIGVPEYLEEAVRTQMSFLGCEPSVVAIDLHPAYTNRRVARRIAEEYGSEIVEVQHHWAHASALLTDNSRESAAVLTLDGTGHGDDGTAWGGEVLMSDFHSYDRVCHLQPIPLLGAQKALYDLRRLKFAIDCINHTENDDFKPGEAVILGKMMGTSVTTSSFGRILDAISYTLGVCRERTYDGEPAMKLERLLSNGRLIDGYVPDVSKDTVMTAELFSRIDPKDRREDVAYSMVHGIIGKLTEHACDAADRYGTPYVGITGGVSYNSTISRMFGDMVLTSDHIPLFHSDIPNGDGGISIGQIAIALRRNR